MTVQDIKTRIESGTDPSTIAVLARRHHELVSLLPYFADAGIHVSYERRDNVLESEVIVQLLTLVRIVCAIAAGDLDEADALLPTLLSHPAWQFDNESVWRLSLAAYKHRGGWLEEMATDPKFKPLHEWLNDMAKSCLNQPAEQVIDTLTGYPSEDRDDGAFHSPLYPYFFSESMRTGSPDEYVSYLEALRTIRAKLRDYRPDASLGLQDFVDFVDLHQRLGSAITSVRIRAEATSASVNLMTAHKSKGLEFDHVYVIGAIDSAWGEQVRTRSRLISYPENLPIRPSGDTSDERLRLFFVAMTRARRTLTISSSSTNETGKETLVASFLSWAEPDIQDVPATTDDAVLVEELRAEWYRPYINVGEDTMHRVLAPTLENYRLSVTHLTSFLDITRGGPQYFLLNNLLHFPTTKHPSAQFGSAIHAALQRAHAHFSATGKRKPVEDVLQDFEAQLGSYRLSGSDYQAYLQRGVASLSAFLASSYDDFLPTQKVEVSFAGQQSMVGQATLTGALDLMNIDDEAKRIAVVDYKTGGASTKWQGKSDGEKLKLHRYRQQLLFYKLLVERSRDYHDYVVDAGTLSFVEPTPDGRIVSLDLTFNEAELEEFCELIEKVHDMIISLNMPDTSQYPPTMAGVLAFEADIRAGKY